MSISVMKKLTVIAPRSQADTLVRKLMKLRAVSLVPLEDVSLSPLARPSDQALAEATAKAAQVDGVIPVLAKYSKRKKSLFSPPVTVDAEEFELTGKEEKAWATVHETERILKGQAELRAEIAAAEAEMQNLAPYRAFPYALNHKGTVSTRFFFGSFPGGFKPERVAEIGCELGFDPTVLANESSGLFIAGLCHRAEYEEIRHGLAPYGFLPAAFQNDEGTATALYAALADKIARYEKALERLQAQVETLAENISEVEILSDRCHTALRAEQSKLSLAATADCVVLSGWCPRDATDRITLALERCNAAYEFADPAEGEEPPILLRNNGYASVFEWVLCMYAYPKYGRFDPTFIMSIFYFLIFGLMFADAGYGLLLSVLCFSVVALFKPRESMKRFLLMFGYCGISSLIFGVIFGSYFGNFPLAFMENIMGIPAEELPRLSLIPAEDANIALLFDPLLNPMGFLVVSLAAGALHILVGMAVKAFILCRDGNWLDAIFDIGSYYALFAGIGLSCLAGTRTAGIITLSVGVTMILLTQGRAKKGIVGKIIGGLGGLYSLINYASDLLSYSRILALGLAAGVIGQVVNILATMGGPTFGGFIVMILAFTLGHVLNLAINVLGTFVHTARLQYIEFFGRFFEDGGTPFRPMAPADKYSEETPDMDDLPIPH